MQAWDRLRTDLMPRHVVVALAAFVRVQLGDALVLRVVADILEVHLPFPFPSWLLALGDG